MRFARDFSTSIEMPDFLLRQCAYPGAAAGKQAGRQSGPPIRRRVQGLPHDGDRRVAAADRTQFMTPMIDEVLRQTT